MRVEVEVAEIAEAFAVAGHRAKSHVSGADLIAGRAALRREHLQLEPRDPGGRSGYHLADRSAARHLLQGGGPPRGAGPRDVRKHHRRGRAVEAGESADVTKTRRRDDGRAE